MGEYSLAKIDKLCFEIGTETREKTIEHVVIFRSELGPKPKPVEAPPTRHRTLHICKRKR